MSVKIRLKRLGRKKMPFYRLVVSDARSSRQGKSIEEIGIYQPLQDPPLIKVKEDRALYWLGAGAEPTDTVRDILSRLGVMSKFAQNKVASAKERNQ